MTDRWWGVLIVIAGLAMIWTARDSAEVSYEVAEWQRKRAPRSLRWLYGWPIARPAVGTVVGRVLGVIVALAGLALVVSPDFFGAFR